MRQELIESALSHVTDKVAVPASLADAEVRALKKLLYKLEPLVGTHGANALYARSLHLAKRVHPSLSSVTAGQRADQLAGLRADLAGMEVAEARVVAICLLNIFADLLTSLIGEPLTNRLLRSAWNDPPVSAEPAEEKAK